MKKHELLEKAMRDYPKGTKFKWNNFEHVSTGVFSLDNINDYVICVGLIHNCDDCVSDKVLIWNGTKWPEIVNQNRIDDRVFVINSEENIPLYLGDDYWCPQLGDIKKKWRDEPRKFTVKESARKNENNMFFATKEAAEIWINKENAPKNATFYLSNNWECTVFNTGSVIIEDSKVDMTIALTIRDIDVIKSQYEFLQPF